MSASDETREEPAEMIDAVLLPLPFWIWFNALLCCVGYPYGYCIGCETVVVRLVRKYTAAAAPPIKSNSSVSILPMPFFLAMFKLL